VKSYGSARERLVDRAREWRVIIDESFETASSLIAYGRRGAELVALKVLKQEGDEWRSGEVLSRFEGRGAVRVYEHTGGALLLERLRPGHSLVNLALRGRDEEATAILASVISAMSQARAPTGGPTAQALGRAFEWHVTRNDRAISRSLVEQAHRVYSELCDSQTNARLLHGDLQHSNVLFDHERGWLAIDPKGVVGEVEYEVGAALRNPREDPAFVTKPATIERRLLHFASELGLDHSRALGWTFAQAVLSAIWSVEDGVTVNATDPSLLLAYAIRPMLPRYRA
jgi:streptomycin 6-kinase